MRSLLFSLALLTLAQHSYSQSLDSLLTGKNYIRFGIINGFSHVVPDDIFANHYIYIRLNNQQNIMKWTPSSSKRIPETVQHLSSMLNKLR